MIYGVDEVPTINTTKFPAGAMILVKVRSDGKKMKSHWFPKELKIGINEYLDVMEKFRIVKNYPDSNYVWQHDGATAHTSK